VISQRVTISYVDGSTRDVTLTQWSAAQFALYGHQKGWPSFDLHNNPLLSVLCARYQAWAEIHRDPSTPRPSFEVWDLTVNELEAIEEPEPADPTPPATSVG